MIVTKEYYDRIKKYLGGRPFTFEEGCNLPVEERQRLSETFTMTWYSQRLVQLNEKLEAYKEQKGAR